MEQKELEYEGFVIKCYVSESNHSKQYGIESLKPLYLKEIYVDVNKRNKGYGKELINMVEEFANSHNCDLIFGNIPQNADFSKDERVTTFSDVEMIKNWLFKLGYNINSDNNDFHKIIKNKKPLRYYGGVGFNNLKEHGKYEVINEISTKKFDKLSEAKEYYHSVKGEKAIWDLTNDTMLDAWYKM
jgi:GNAT superfamily N-acetyltransferase